MEIKEYTELKQIAESATGEGIVYSAKHLPTREYRCVKTAKDGLHDKLEHERQTLPRIRHPNIVAFFEAGQDNGRHYIVTELMQSSIAELLEIEGKLNYKRAINIVRQAAIGVEHAHRHGILHLDLKPGNILISEDDTAKVCDFSTPDLEKRISHSLSRSSSGKITTTLEYCAPEIRRGEKPTEEADVYSLGIVLYQLVTGKVPDRYPRPITDLTDAPIELDDFIRRTLNENPDERPKLEYAIAELSKLEKKKPTSKRHLFLREHWKPIAGIAGGLLTAITLSLPFSSQNPPETNMPIPSAEAKEFTDTEYWYKIEQKGSDWYVVFPVGLTEFGPSRAIPIEKEAVTLWPNFLRTAEQTDRQHYRFDNYKNSTCPTVGYIPAFMERILSEVGQDGITAEELKKLEKRIIENKKGFETITGIKPGWKNLPPYNR